MKRIILSLILLLPIITNAQLSRAQIDLLWSSRVVPTTTNRQSTWSGFYNITDDGMPWGINGNSVSTNTNFIGTTNSRSLLFYSNNTKRLKIDSIGHSSFSGTLSIGSSTYNPGAILSVATNSSNAVMSVVTRTSNGYAEIYLAADNPTSYLATYHRGSTMATSGLYKPNSGILETLSDELLFLNYQANGKIIFAQGSTGTSGEVMRISDNQCVGISGPASVKITSPTAILHIAAGNTSFPAIALTTQTTPTTITAGTGWFTTGSGFNFAGNAQIHTNSSNIKVADYTSGRPALFVGQTSTSTTNWALSNSTNTTYVNGVNAVAILRGGSIIDVFNANFSASSTPLRVGSLTSPGATLDVSGTMSVSNTSTLNGLVLPSSASVGAVWTATNINGSGTWSTVAGGGGGSPGGSNTQYQYNNSGSFAGSNFVTNSTRHAINSVINTNNMLRVNSTTNGVIAISGISQGSGASDNYGLDFQATLSTGNNIGLRAYGYRDNGSDPANNFCIGGEFLAEGGSNGNYAIRLSDGTEGTVGSIVTASTIDGKCHFSNDITLPGNFSVLTKSISTTSGDAATINSPAGRFRKDNSGSTFTLTNSFISSTSIIICQRVSTGITTGNQIIPVAGSGSAVITFETNGVAAAPNSDCDVNFWIIN